LDIEAAVDATVGAVIGEIERREKLDGMAEMAGGKRMRALGHGLKVFSGAGR